MLTIITGCMFAGKTTTLINKIKEKNKDYIIFKPEIDKRYAVNSVVSHNGDSIPCTPIKNSKDILKFVNNYSLIGIDEVQFFDNDIITICNILANSNKEIFISGLSTDYLGKPFNIVAHLLAISDEIIKVQGICECGNKTNFNKRLNENKDIILVGGESDYKSVCRKCFYNIHDISQDEIYLNL